MLRFYFEVARTAYRRQLFYRLANLARLLTPIFFGAIFSYVMIGIAYRFLFNIVAFWILEARAVAGFATTIALFFSGSYVPLPFFPEWLQTITTWLPFNGLMNVPVQIFLGKLTGEALLFGLGLQVLWVILLTLGVRSLVSIAARRVIVQGG